jgi:molybdopterin converting factor small subunit
LGGEERVEVVVRFFGVLRDLAGCREAQLSLPAKSTLREVLLRLKEKCGAQMWEFLVDADGGRLLSHNSVAINGALMGPDDIDAPVGDGDRIDLVTPVSGG